MLTLRPSQERGHFDFGWLSTYHTFSFADYHDPKHMGFRTLRVINEDWIKPGQGFGTHPHRDMEIITCVLEGALEHKDSMGNGSVIVPGEVQRMSAGRGITHSEFNHSKIDSAHLLQIWILTEKKGIEPSYEQKTFGDKEKRGQLRLIASRDGRKGSVTIHQDTDLYVTLLKNGEKLEHILKPGRHAWVQVARGSVSVNGRDLETGDGAALSEEKFVKLEGQKDTEVLLFDLP